MRSACQRSAHSTAALLLCSRHGPSTRVSCARAVAPIAPRRLSSRLSTSAIATPAASVPPPALRSPSARPLTSPPTTRSNATATALLSSVVAALVACLWPSSPALRCEEERRDEHRIEGVVAPPSPSAVPRSEDGLRLLVAEARTDLSLPDPSLSAEEWQYLQGYVDDCVVFRYLVAHSLHVDRAVRAIKATVRWRLLQRVDAIDAHTSEQLRQKILEHSMWVSRGIACDGSPVVINRKAQTAEENHAAQFELIVYTLERALRSHPPLPPSSFSPSAPLSLRCRQKWVWWLDMRHFNRGSSTPLSEAQRVVDVLMSHYVERLHVAIVLDAPLFFTFIFRAVSVFLPAKTKSKVVFVRDLSKEDTRATVARYIALEQLERPYGLLQPISMLDYIDEEPRFTPPGSTGQG